MERFGGHRARYLLNGDRMRKFTLVSIIIFLQISYAAEWNWEHPKPQGNTLWKVAFYNEWYGYQPDFELVCKDIKSYVDFIVS